MLPKSLLVPTDLADGAARPLEYACEVAGRLGATIHLVHVVPDDADDRALADHRTLLHAIANRYRARATLGQEIVERGDATTVILDTSRSVDADLIIMGTHGRRGLSRVLLGSVAELVVRHSPCPVLTIHTHDPDGTSLARRVA